MIKIPIFDYKCTLCGYEQEVILIHICEDIEWSCDKCNGKSIKIAPQSAPSFELKYNNKTDMVDWSGNTSRYWDDYKAAKARGEDVKPLGED